MNSIIVLISFYCCLSTAIHIPLNDEKTNKQLGLLRERRKTEDCCPPVYKHYHSASRGVCADGTLANSCGNGQCDINGCNCDGGCRSSNKTFIYVGQWWSCTFWNGEAVFTTDNTCQDLGWWKTKMSAFGTINGCVQVFKNDNCEGWTQCVCANYPQNEWLDGSQRDNHIFKSFRKCQPPPYLKNGYQQY